MRRGFLPNSDGEKRVYYALTYNNLKYFAKEVAQNWKWRVLMLALLVWMAYTKEISFQFSIQNNNALPIQRTEQLSVIDVPQPKTVALEQKIITVEQPSTVAATFTPAVDTPIQQTKPSVRKQKAQQEVTMLSKRDKQISYVRRFAKVAQVEMKRYGIPASITLAQGLIESNDGHSKLATQNNNHFGIKCFARNCKKGHCTNHTDDSHKDFFVNYNSAWESYRAHSLFLQKKRYKKLFDLDIKDYKGWAHGLKKAGYATDPRYAHKLIQVIEALELYRLDDTSKIAN